MPLDSNPSPPENELSELLNIGFPADPEAIGTATDAITETLIELQVPEQKRLEIGLAVQEALVNAVVHGCKNDPSKEVRCRLQSDPLGRIVITVADPGPGFSPDLLSDPKRRENLHADHGRGVYLIRQLMDEVHFERSGNEIRMWKY
jgi:serine/threonine-protein kinase RsbW